MKNARKAVIAVVLAAVGYSYAQLPSAKAAPPGTPTEATAGAPGAEPSELTAARKQYDDRVQDLHTKVPNAIKLRRDRYVGELRILAGKIAAGGNLDALTPINAEEKAYEGGFDTIGFDAKDTTVPPAARQLRVAFEADLARIAQYAAGEERNYLTAYERQLEDLEKKLTIAGNLDGAIAIRAEKKSAQALIADNTPPPATPAPATPATPAAKPARASPAPVAPGAIQPAGPGPLLARDWDIQISIPAGGYRAPKPIAVNGDFDEKIEPGAVLEGVTLQGKSHVQHWHIDGAILRKVRITGQLGVSMEAANSVFEDCDFYKDSGWFVSYWGTRWRFENCIFTKRFMKSDLTPDDYSVHATHCTFYEVKLPPISTKDNPADYMQKENMGFEKCRFVNCEVPETVLAASVDCVFEGCQFAPKRHTWPKKSEAIKVNAYYSGLGGTPQPFVNGPLSVQFTEAPRNVEAGATLKHTKSAARITLTDLREPDRFIVVGVEQRKSSEIPASGDLPPAGTPAKPLIAAAAANELHSLDEILRDLPLSINLLSGGKLDVAGVDAANLWLAKTCAGRPITLKTFIESMRSVDEDGYAFKVVARSQLVLSKGISVPTSAAAFYQSGPAAALSKVVKGDEIVIRGTVKSAVLEGRGKAVGMTVTIGDAHTP